MTLSCAILSSLKIMIIFNWNQNKVSWCIIGNDHNLEQNEDRETVFLKWTDFSRIIKSSSKISHLQKRHLTIFVTYIWVKYLCINHPLDSYIKYICFFIICICTYLVLVTINIFLTAKYLLDEMSSHHCHLHYFSDSNRAVGSSENPEGPVVM